METTDLAVLQAFVIYLVRIGPGLGQFYANDDRLPAGMTQMVQTYME